jgi:N-acetylneuraminate synthase
MKNDFSFEIDGRKIGPSEKPYIVAEISANHNGDIEKALAHIEAAANCGAAAVKIQTYTPDTMTIDSEKPDFQIHGGLWDGYTLYNLYKEAHTPYEWHKAMFAKAKEVGITIFSTPFDETAVELLEALNAPAYKIASFEMTDLHLIKRVAQTGKPMIISTGMANFEEIQETVATAKQNGCRDLIVLHCLSSYPAPVDECNLQTIPDLRNKLGVNIGLSDHTITHTAAITSVALGAVFIEKHFIIDRNDKGPDSSFSIEPNELRKLVNETSNAHAALGTANYQRKPCEEDNIKFRRSLYFVKDLKAGDLIEKQHIRRIRPGLGLAPKFYTDILGKKVTQNIDRGTAVSWEHIQHG